MAMSPRSSRSSAPASEELLDAVRASVLRRLRDMTAQERLTLLTATNEVESSQAAVLVGLIRADAAPGTSRVDRPAT